MGAMALRVIWLPLIVVLGSFVSGTPAAAAAVAPITVAQLPNDPTGACSNQAVRTALATCRITGASAACCSGLDAVFANSSSPSWGCLCIPQVLYKTLAVASDAGLDVLGVLHKCRKAQPQDFQTQWASAQPSACPHITFGLNPAELIMQLGPDIVLASSKGRPAWAFSNVLQFGQIMQEVPEIGPIWDHVVGSRFANLMYLVIILMPPLFFVAHFGVLPPLSAEYRRLAPAEQLVVAQHAVYVFVFSLSLIPQTVLASTALFKAWTGWYLDSAQLPALLGVFIASRTVLYVVEASVRSVVKWSWLLIVHHLLFFLIVLLAFWCASPAAAGMGFVLDLFACHEAPLYVALLAYRLRWPPRLTRAVLRGAMGWYVATRVFQTVVLAYMVAGFARMRAVRATPAFVVTAVLAGTLTAIQAYTLVIYTAMDRKVSAAIRGGGGGGTLPPRGTAVAVLPKAARAGGDGSDTASVEGAVSVVCTAAGLEGAAAGLAQGGKGV